MKVIHIPLPPGSISRYYDSAELDEHDLKNVPAGTDILVYYYGRGDYEGNGNALLRINGVWHYANMSHCSCYGPTEDFPGKPIGCFKDWLENATPEFRAEVLPLVEALINNIIVDETHQAK